jgi:hypothetical protein
VFGAVDADEPTQPTPIIRPARPRPRPPRRRLAIPAGVVALAVAIAGGAFALGRTEAGDATSTRLRHDATTIATTPTTATTAPIPTSAVVRGSTGASPTVGLSGDAEQPTTPASTPPAPPTTAPASSPLPPGTRTGFVPLDGSVEFTPAEAVSGARMSYTATLTNPFDQWVFEAATEGLSLYLYTPATEDSGLSPYIVGGVPSSAPELRHQTPTGLEIGLLLAPHASYTFSGQAFNTVESFATSDYDARADIIFTPPGVADVVGQIVRDAGSFRVLVPPATTTTTTSTPSTTSGTATAGATG